MNTKEVLYFYLDPSFNGPKKCFANVIYVMLFFYPLVIVVPSVIVIIVPDPPSVPVHFLELKIIELGWGKKPLN